MPRTGERTPLAEAEALAVQVVTMRAPTCPPPRRAPAPTRLGWALGLVILILATGIGVAVARAQEIDAAALVPAAVATEPTPEPTATEPARWQPSARGGRDGVRELAERHFAPEWVAWAVRVAVCESSLNPNADTNPPYIGLWQIDPHIHSGRVLRIFGGWRSLYEPEVNAAVAADILADQGPGAWPICGR